MVRNKEIRALTALHKSYFTCFGKTKDIYITIEVFRFTRSKLPAVIVYYISYIMYQMIGTFKQKQFLQKMIYSMVLP